MPLRGPAFRALPRPLRSFCLAAYDKRGGVVDWGARSPVEANRVIRVLAILALACAPTLARAVVDVPGAALDNPGVQDLHVGFYYRLGRVAEVKGAPPPNSVSDVRGNIKGGFVNQGVQWDTVFPYFVPPEPSPIGALALPLPVAQGAVGINTTALNPGDGLFLQAIIYEPDQVRRKGDGTKSAQVKIQQKKHVAVRWGRFLGSGQNISQEQSIGGGTRYEDCRAQLDLKRRANKTPDTVARFKFKCSGNSPEVQQIKMLLTTIFGKSRNGFDLTNSFSAYDIAP